MTETNAPKMSLEEKLVQTLKDEKLYALLGDEDALTELVKRAIHEALYQPTRIKKEYGGWEDRDSLVVATAKEIGKKVAESLVSTMAQEALADPEIKKAVNNAIAVCMPGAISGSLSSAVCSFQQIATVDSFAKVQEAIKNRTL